MSNFDISPNTTNNSMETTDFFNLSDLTITGITPEGQPIVLNISSNTTNESIDLSIISNDGVDYSFSDDGSLHLSDLNISSSGFSNNTTQEGYPFTSPVSPIHSHPNSPNSFYSGGKKSRKLKKRNKNKKKRKTKKK
jgi:hypothetical protein